jgi:hypothetical protein
LQLWNQVALNTPLVATIQQGETWPERPVWPTQVFGNENEILASSFWITLMDTSLLISMPEPSRQGARKCMLVLGMHRSGTSALARIVNLLGASLPKNVAGASGSNERGHWEPLRLVELHDELLAELNSRWDDWRSVDLTMLSAERFSHYQAEIVRIITEEFPSLELFVVKDPRICRLMPLWRNALAELRTEVRCVIPFRHPTEVARSLGLRTGLPHIWGYLLWLRHILEAERQTRDLRRSFVNYQDIIEHADSVASRVASELAEDAFTYGLRVNMKL